MKAVISGMKILTSIRAAQKKNSGGMALAPLAKRWRQRMALVAAALRRQHGENNVMAEMAIAEGGTGVVAAVV
jgi:hypothetical protein